MLYTLNTKMTWYAFFLCLSIYVSPGPRQQPVSKLRQVPVDRYGLWGNCGEKETHFVTRGGITASLLAVLIQPRAPACPPSLEKV